MTNLNESSLGDFRNLDRLGLPPANNSDWTDIPFEGFSFLLSSRFLKVSEEGARDPLFTTVEVTESQCSKGLNKENAKKV